MLAPMACAWVASLPHRTEAVKVVSEFRQDSDRRRTILPNGAVVRIDRVPHADRLILQLFVSSRALSTDETTNGQRHLMEHLTALGFHKELDRRLESNAAFLTAQTLRDATVYQICLRPDDLNLGLQSVASLMQLAECSPEQILHESNIIRQEAALQSPSMVIAEAAWQAAFGREGGDPLGNPDAIGLTTPAALARLHRDQFVGSNLTLLISGNLDLNSTTALAAQVLETAAAVPEVAVPPRSFSVGAKASVDVEGEAVACYAESWNSPRTAARLAAALSIAANISDSFVIYTPSLRGSLIVVGHTGESDGLDKVIAKLSPAAEFAFGRNLAEKWVEARSANRDQNVLTGLLVSEGAGQRPETLLQNLSDMSYRQFAAAVADFRSSECVRVIGR